VVVEEKEAEEAGEEVATTKVVEAEDKIMVVVAEAEEAEALKPAIILQKNGINCPKSSAWKFWKLVVPNGILEHVQRAYSNIFKLYDYVRKRTINVIWKYLSRTYATTVISKKLK